MKQVKVKDLKAGDIVKFDCGTFKVKFDAVLTSDKDGDVYRTESECLTGRAGNYFYPTSEWTFQGNNLRTVEVFENNFMVLHTDGGVNSYHETKEQAQVACDLINDKEAYLHSHYVVVEVQ